MQKRPAGLVVAAAVFLFCLGTAHAEDGYDLWLRYRPLPVAEREALAPLARTIVTASGKPSPTVRVAIAELRRGLGGLLAADVPESVTPADGAIVLGTPADMPAIAALHLPLDGLGSEGYVIRGAEIADHEVTVVAANGDRGLLYGAFALLRRAQTGAGLAGIDIASKPKIGLRVLNHWDNLDGTIERGYAGQSLWDWWHLPDFRDPRYTDYARANASVGINGTVLNNVNANADSLTARYIAKAAALADVFRPYGIRVYLSARFSAPMEIGGLDTADPLDPKVRDWWRTKADEIYAAIPDFGGFLVKANSEGQPGPQDYGRSHADGANMLAAAVAPHGGIVMWRAFVYASDNAEDRAKQAYDEFKPLDGKFADNVLVQVKNGPIDFQPREPFHPLFGAMPHTPLMMEFQITKEYLGFATHLVYLGALYEEVLKADTYAKGPGSTVARIIDGELHGYARTGIAGVANTGDDRDWCGSTFEQANWYAFGRLAWDPEASARSIAREWLEMTFTDDERFVEPALGMMMRSREAVVDYMTPLGLAHLMATGHHYGPGPWVDDLDRPEWNPVYYHRADADGIGFDRTKSGSDAVAQYAKPVARRFGDLDTVSDQYLLWFHHLPWDYRMKSGETLWQELVAHYGRGVAEVEALQATWASLEPWVDAERFEKTRVYLEVQHREALWWRDACVSYFMHVSGRALPAGSRVPAHSLEYYEALSFPYAPGH
ncbi:MAG: alpha-glucuronidase family glycosyl hydrolase [Woeseiaceae bacterium]